MDLAIPIVVEQNFIISGIILLAAITQSLTGFGFALVAVSLLPSVISIKFVVPLVALVSTLSNGILWFYYRQLFNLKAVLPLTFAALIAMPFGITALHYLSEKFVLRSLGILIIGYALYDFFNLALPKLASPSWAYVFGFLSGLLTGAYNTGGPPVVVYGSCRRWQPETFKSNLPGFFLINSIIAVVGHGIQGSLTPTVWTLALLAIPPFVVGLAIGIVWSKNLNPSAFKRVILVLLILTGLKLVLVQS